MRGRRLKTPGRSPEEDKETYTPPRSELGTSDEIIHHGRQDYAYEKIPRWPMSDSARQYIATPEGTQEIQHGIVTWIDEANENPRNDQIEREHQPGHRRLRRKPPDLEL